jgi:hypothetical protein
MSNLKELITSSRTNYNTELNKFEVLNKEHGAILDRYDVKRDVLKEAEDKERDAIHVKYKAKMKALEEAEEKEFKKLNRYQKFQNTALMNSIPFTYKSKKLRLYLYDQGFWLGGSSSKPEGASYDPGAAGIIKLRVTLPGGTTKNYTEKTLEGMSEAEIVELAADCLATKTFVMPGKKSPEQTLV